MFRRLSLLFAAALLFPLAGPLPAAQAVDETICTISGTFTVNPGIHTISPVDTTLTIDATFGCPNDLTGTLHESVSFSNARCEVAGADIGPIETYTIHWMGGQRSELNTNVFTVTFADVGGSYDNEGAVAPGGTFGGHQFVQTGVLTASQGSCLDSGGLTEATIQLGSTITFANN